jgi:DNA polymerase III subunit delta'
MSFAQFAETESPVELLERSLARGRLGHAYLFSGDDLDKLELVARTLAKALNCEQPKKNPHVPGAPDSCDACLSCRKIDNATHPDVQWIRPESKSRVITIDQMRDTMQTVFLKPTEAQFKVAVIVGADRLNDAAANAFLKTLEEPPSRSVFILLTTEPGRILETIISRCLRLNFSADTNRFHAPVFLDWLTQFSQAAITEQGSLLSRYRLLSVLLTRLGELKEKISEDLAARSPLERYDDIDPKLRDKWEDELSASVEAEYRRQRADLLTALELWLRDLWLSTRQTPTELLTFPQLAAASQSIAARVKPEHAMENINVIECTQRMLHTNVQEALALEVGLLKLRF